MFNRDQHLEGMASRETIRSESPNLFRLAAPYRKE